MSEREPGETRRLTRAALRFVILIGIVSLFADMTHEAARSINGPFLAVLGASAAAVGLVSGLGELLGYLVRLASGYAAGRSGRYWLWTAAGYLVNLLAVPALALAGRWPVAAGLIVVERVGRGLRNPPRDTMLSHAGSVIGQGWAFALREALDQAGAVVGPLLVALVLSRQGGRFSTAYAWLLAPALCSLAVLALSRWLFPRPRSLEPALAAASALPGAYWTYVVAMALMAIGYADFNLISFHLERAGHPPAVIPLLYALAMGMAGISALVFGRWFDRSGLPVLALAVGISAGFAPLAFFGGLGAAAVGVALWGVGMGVQDSLMSAPVAVMVQAASRARALGVMNALYGVAWFAGSTAMGLIYERSLLGLVLLSVLAQLLAAAVLPFARHHRLSAGGQA